MLTSNEKPIRDLARAVKMERQHGEALRLIDLPAVFDDLHHMFDRLPQNFHQSNFHEWKKQTLISLMKTVCSRFIRYY